MLIYSSFILIQAASTPGPDIRNLWPARTHVEKEQRRLNVDPGSPYASSTTLRYEWPFPSPNETPDIDQALASWVLKDKDTVDEVRKSVEILIFPPSTTPYDDLFLSILHEDDARNRRRGEVALDDDGKRENLEGGVGCDLLPINATWRGARETTSSSGEQT
ncbi:uncharacterized protein ARMOST_20247 [Armillaria ostoyae]|uniref:Uncharacterized protein n=1 Tax=Armillaria ostoyae TaxID=47428 RepID=A0A284S6T9_ARMOS|nr:uncharacterized protein ARMOST_20247 [Armillaria ostoyae]